MKKPQFGILITLTVVFCAFTLGFYLGKNRNGPAATIHVSASALAQPTEAAEVEPPPSEAADTVSYPININTADAHTLSALPGIGTVLADRIVAYRDTNGPFSHTEELLGVEGIGENKMETIWDLVTIGG